MIRCARLVDRRQGGSTMLMSCSGPVASEENVFPFPSETLDDVPRNESCRLADQLLLKLAGSPRKSELTPVDPWRSVIAGAVRRRSLCGTTTVRLEGRTVRHLRPRRTLDVLQCVVSLADNSLPPADLVPVRCGRAPAVATDLQAIVGHGDEVHLCASAGEWPPSRHLGKVRIDLDTGMGSVGVAPTAHLVLDTTLGHLPDMSGAMGTRLESRVSGQQASICASHCRPLGSTTCTA